MLALTSATMALRGGVMPTAPARAGVSMASADEFTIAVLGDLHVSAIACLAQAFSAVASRP